ncbi:TPA: hypothetical protein G8O09_003526 [Salmonella enterica]|uniref:Uncharacterized protein n=1 Tax=Salmonella enterica TaxID=28901 RepID=A0A748CK87_SALER|nr:hypothetical protein [Salmonella enterica]HAF4945296.1 hypothetical protein [Salmonella enterica]
MIEQSSHSRKDMTRPSYGRRTPEFITLLTGAYNVYYVKWWAETHKPLVIYVKTEKTFSPMPFIVYVVHF